MRLSKPVTRFLIVLFIFLFIAMPFKTLELIPGVTELRPVNAIVVGAGLICGFEGSLAVAVGNLISDTFGGTLTIYSSVGFLGNFLGAFIPFKVWHLLRIGKPNARTSRNILLYELNCLLSASIIALIIGAGYSYGNSALEPLVTRTIFFNQWVFSATLGLPIFIVAASDVFDLSYAAPTEPALLGLLPSDRRPFGLFALLSRRTLRVAVAKIFVAIATVLSVLIVVLCGFYDFSFKDGLVPFLLIADYLALMVLCF